MTKIASVSRVTFKHIPSGMMFYYYARYDSGTVYLRASPYDNDRLPYVRHVNRGYDNIVFCVPQELVPERYRCEYRKQLYGKYYQFCNDDSHNCNYLLTYIQMVPVTVDILCG